MSAAIRVINFYGLVNCTSDGEDREGGRRFQWLLRHVGTCPKGTVGSTESVRPAAVVLRACSPARCNKLTAVHRIFTAESDGASASLLLVPGQAASTYPKC